MPEFEPFVLLPAQRGEYERKPGGGGAATPIVPVTTALRSSLADQLADVAALAERDYPGAGQGLPLAITVREEALAKTKRPYAFLAASELAPVAAERRGELVSRATPESARALEHAIRSRQTKADVYAISTFESFRVWDPIEDAFRLNEQQPSPQDILDAARAERLPLKVELFPWLSVQSIWAGRTTTLEDYLGEIGLPIRYVAGTRSRTALYLEVTDDVTAEAFRALYGIRSATLTPSYAAPGPILQQSFRVVSRSIPVAVEEPDGIEAAVGVFDSGVEEGVLEPWVAARWTYDLGSDRDTTHGTFVAGLIVAGRALNNNTQSLPNDPALVYDAQVLPNGGITEDLLIERMAEVLDQAGPTGPRVWNCSFNNVQHLDPVEYTTLSQELDLLSREHGILIVQSAGNYNNLRQVWPPDGSDGPRDAIASPAETVDSLTVGALSHLGGKTPIDAVASYSRRGPSFGGQQKPDLGHYAGDVSANDQLEGFGIQSVGPNDEVLESVGTSFATPLVSAMAANVWRDLEVSQAVGTVHPALVKGLLVHSATVANKPIEDAHRVYYGAGVPRGESMALFDAPHTFSTIHEVELRTGVNWEKRPFPMPDCLFDDKGKIRAAVSLTVCYSPVIDAAFGEECIRTCVEPSFGHYVDDDGDEKFSGAMGGSHDWEKGLVERGKWSPVKTYRKVWKRGVDGSGDWALKLRLTARDSSIEPLVQRTFVIVTVEGLDETQPVRQDGLAAIAELRYPSSLVVDSGRLRVTNLP